MIEKIFGNKEENIKYQERIGAYAIIFDDGKVATVKVPKGHFLIGGKVEDDESHQECIVRESLEETGYEVEVKQFLLKSETYCYIEGYYRQICYYYLVNIKDKVVDPIEIDHKFEWLDIENIESAIYVEHQKWALKCAIDMK